MAGKKKIIRGRTPAEDGTRDGTAWWVYPLLFVLAVAPYLQTLSHDFVNFDDGSYVSENLLVRQGLTSNNIVWAFTVFWAGNWHPLTWLSHMLDCQLFGMNPGAHHMVNVAIHGMSTVTLFVAMRTMTGKVWRSAFVAALFAVHPLHVESVAWVAERKDVLSTFFGLVAILCYARYARSRSVGRYVVVALFFALSLMSKPMLVTFPFVLLLLDVWPLKRFAMEKERWASLILEKLPLLAMSVASSIVTFKAQHAAGAVQPIELLPLGRRLTNAINAYADYLYKTFWPVNMAAFYPFPDEIPVGQVVIALLVLIGITTGVVILARARPWLIVGWLLYLGTLVPVIGFVQVGDQSMADRYTYLPLIGIFFMIAWSIPYSGLADNHRKVVSFLIAAILLGLSSLTFAQVRVWKNTTTLFEHAIEVTKGNFLAHNLLAGAIGQTGDLDGARDQIEKALQLKPNYAGAHYNLGMIMLYRRDFEKAQEEFNFALQANKLDPMAWNALGVAQVNLGKTDEAIANYRHAIELDPSFAEAFTDLGAALLQKQKFEEAIDASEKSLQLRPGLAESHATIGAAYWNLGKATESIFHNQRAVELSPNLVSARVNLAVALFAKGRVDEAITHAEYALNIDPNNQIARRIVSVAQQQREGSVPTPAASPSP
jgi:tetratricopeptide (TPR) repeat protein